MWFKEYKLIVEDLGREKQIEEALEMIKEEELEIDLFRKYNKWYGSVFYVMQKKSC